jgi:hypothetical protein
MDRKRTKRIELHPHNTISREALTCLAKPHSLQASPRDLSAARWRRPTFACRRTHSMDRLPTEGDDAPDDTWGDIDAAQAPSMR